MKIGTFTDVSIFRRTIQTCVHLCRHVVKLYIFVCLNLYMRLFAAVMYICVYMFMNFLHVHEFVSPIYFINQEFHEIDNSIFSTALCVRTYGAFFPNFSQGIW